VSVVSDRSSPRRDLPRRVASWLRRGRRQSSHPPKYLLDPILAGADTIAVWQIDSYGDKYDNWFDSLTEPQQNAVLARLSLLADRGPALGRPTVDTVEDSRHQNMKELRCSKDGALRILFVFDPLRKAILLIGGDKTGQWSTWYRAQIPVADALYDRYLQELKDEGLI